MTGDNHEIAVTGWGAVSAAGWNASSLFEAITSNSICPPQLVQREGGMEVQTRAVPALDRSKRSRHPRLRRASPQVKFAASACIEALGEKRIDHVRNGDLRLGVVFATMCGAVQYSNRFYGEVLNDPATASPILFPETVFNAPSSHLSALLGTSSINYTLVGDSAEFLPALSLGKQWLLEDQVDGCLVVGAEELDWVNWEAMQLFHKGSIATEGAGVLYLERATSESKIVLKQITDSLTWLNLKDRKDATLKTRQALSSSLPDSALLVKSAVGNSRLDSAENHAWINWGTALSPGTVLGNAMGAATPLNCVVACEALARGSSRHAVISAAGHHHQCAAAWLSHS